MLINEITKRVVGILFCLFPYMGQAISSENPHKVIRQMLEQLDKHHSFSYDEENATWMPGETEQDGTIRRTHTLEVVDTNEPYVGARFVCTDNNQIRLAYDGKKRLRSTKEPLVFEVDSLFKGITKYRVVPRPFYQIAKTIGQYILSTTDSVQIEMQETANEYQIKVSIFTNDQVEFTMGRLSPYIPEVPEAGIFYIPPHTYILHIDKSTYMPMKYYKIFNQNSSMGRVTNVKYDTQHLKDFDIYTYLPPNHFFQNQESKKKVKNKLNRGDAVPDFELSDTEGQVHKLSQYRGHVVLVEFTSIACSVCQIVPVFLHQLSQEFPQIQILSIEAWNMKPSSCANWIKQKGITHPYLLNGKDIQPLYTDNTAVPAFFIIDADGKLVAEFTGYNEKNTPPAISKVLRSLPL